MNFCSVLIVKLMRRLWVITAIVLVTLQGCALRTILPETWVSEQQAIDPKVQLRDYSKKLAALLPVGRCVVNTGNAVSELSASSSFDLDSVTELYQDLTVRQNAVSEDHRRIREVIQNTTANATNYMQPYSHLSPFSALWYDTISPQDWDEIESRYQGHIAFLENLSEQSISGYRELLVADPRSDRSILLRPVLCVTAIAELIQGVKQDAASFFDNTAEYDKKAVAQRLSAMWHRGVSGLTSSWRNLRTTSAVKEHVFWVNRLHGYRDGCTCYTQTQNWYALTGARFYRQNQIYGDQLCARVNSADVKALDTTLRDFVDNTHRIRGNAEDLMTKVSVADNNPFDDEGTKAHLELMEQNSQALLRVARAQFAESFRNRADSTVDPARQALMCFYEASARADSGSYYTTESATKSSQ